MAKKVEQLRYAGDDESGGYVEALLIRENGEEHYVLHRGQSVRSSGENGKFIHEKIEFDTEKKLVDAFPYAFGEKWVKTDSVCGYDISRQDVQAAHGRRLSKILKPQEEF